MGDNEHGDHGGGDYSDGGGDYSHGGGDYSDGVGITVNVWGLQ